MVYNHPRKNPSSFLDYLQTTLSKLTRENKLIFLSGDFNIDLLKVDKSPIADSFLNLMLSNFFKPLIIKPTRIVDNSSPSLIDNIFINSLEPTTISGNLINKISDHLPSFTFFETGNKIKVKKQTMIRDYRNFNKDNYINEAKEINLYSSNATSSLNLKYEAFHNKFLDLLNKHAPLKKSLSVLRNYNVNLG